MTGWMVAQATTSIYLVPERKSINPILFNML